MVQQFTVLLYYKYVEIDNPEQFVKEQTELCRSLGLLGRILIGKEGLNGTVSGTKEQTEKYKAALRNDPRFSDVVFKESVSDFVPFGKLWIRVRDEIVGLKTNADLQKTGKRVSPEQLKEMLDNGEDVILLDARNDYEWQIGRFKNALTLPIKNFRDFPQAVEKIKHLKNKKIVTYCTGGIRCEKASAVLKEQGFENVAQLQDGLVTFGERFPDTHWEGRCYVFDNRYSIPLNKKNVEPISDCELCKAKCDRFINCCNVDCNKRFICCDACFEKMNGGCSEFCSKRNRWDQKKMVCLPKKIALLS